MNKQSGRSLYLRAERDSDRRYPKPKGESKQISNQQLRAFLKNELTKEIKSV